MQEKNLQLERLVFFCDAVVAIAITLLALNIKIENPVGGHLHFSDITKQWKTFAAFSLSFVNIANFWKTHHSFFYYIKKVDEKLLWYNICWLFFIVLLPFSTSLVSSYFFDHTAIAVYSLNTLLIALFQNNIWDYASEKADFIKTESIDTNTAWMFRLFCNLELINALLAIGISFLNPTVAFILLFTKLPIMLIARVFYGGKIRESFGDRRKKTGVDEP